MAANKYKPEYCAKVIALGTKGYSLEMIAAELKMTWAGCKLWERTHPEFMDALQQAKLNEMAFFEKLAIDYMIEQPQGAKLNTGLWAKSMAARFPNKYRDNSRIEMAGVPGQPVEVIGLSFTENMLKQLLVARQQEGQLIDVTPEDSK